MNFSPVRIASRYSFLLDRLLGFPAQSAVVAGDGDGNIPHLAVAGEPPLFEHRLSPYFNALREGRIRHNTFLALRQSSAPVFFGCFHLTPRDRRKWDSFLPTFPHRSLCQWHICT